MPTDRVQNLTPVIVVGSGRVGKLAIRALQGGPNLRLVGLVVSSNDKRGEDAGVLAGIDPIGVRACAELAEAADGVRGGIVLHCAPCTESQLYELFTDCVGLGLHCATVSGAIDPVLAFGREDARRLSHTARSAGVALVGTGVNPGFLLDVLPWAVGSIIHRPVAITARRNVEMGFFGDAVLNALGFGAQEPRRSVSELVPLEESLAIVAESVGLQEPQVEGGTEVRLAERTYTAHGRLVESGTVDGVTQWLAARSTECVIELSWTAHFNSDDRGTQVGVRGVDGGTAQLELVGSHDEDPYPATVARSLFLAARLPAVAPGLYGPHAPWPLTSLGDSG